MRALFISLIVAAIATPFTARSDSSGSLEAEAEAVTIEIQRASASRRYVRLQSLTFPLLVKTSCPLTMRADSISISAADASKTFGASDLDAQGIINTTLTIPRRQVVPLAVAGFCTHDEPAQGGQLKVPDAYTATISLRCSSEKQVSIVYASQPLDIVLFCESKEDEAEARIDQDASSTSTER